MNEIMFEIFSFYYTYFFNSTPENNGVEISMILTYISCALIVVMFILIILAVAYFIYSICSKFWR